MPTPKEPMPKVPLRKNYTKTEKVAIHSKTMQHIRLLGDQFLERKSASHVLPIERCDNRPVSETGGARTSDLMSSSQQNIHIKGNGVSCRDRNGPAQFGTSLTATLPHSTRSTSLFGSLWSFGTLSFGTASGPAASWFWDLTTGATVMTK